ncbi:glycosyltransferase family 4 protein [Desulfosediminicola sp.]|uniref:glycosyltransferase family 4 protein n=1 Tax=Desulfosediminicola sp. TaxID=2886825 RepID=UPI003AF2E77B
MKKYLDNVFEHKGVRASMDPIHEKIKVLAIVPGDPHVVDGGISKLLIYFSRMLGEQFPNVDLTIQPTRLFQTAPWNHISTPLCVLQFILNLAFGRYDVAHIHVAPRGSTFRKILFFHVARLFGLKIVLHLHGSGYDVFFERQFPYVQNIIKKFFRSADAIIVLGQYWQKFMLEKIGAPHDIVVKIDNGVPDQGLLATRAGAPPSLIFLGAVGYRKGVDVLIDALANLLDLEWKVVICGGGNLEKYRRMATAAGIESNRIIFTGLQSEEQVNQRLLNADIFILPSRAENQPVAILEAMSFGLPVISTKIGDIPGLVKDGFTGRVVEPSDVDGLADAIRSLLEDSDLREKMGQRGLARFKAKYSIAQNVKHTVKLYYRLRKNRINT